MTLDDLRIECRWSKAEMARQARIDTNTLNRAINGIPVSSDTARKLASAISQGLGRSISVDQIEGLKIIE
jgi:DNA-binding XRE family transcriptional regulator